MHIRKTFWAALVLLLLLYIASQFIKDIAFTRAAAVVLILIVTGFIWTNETLGALSITRSAREYRQQAGQIFNEQFNVHNKGRLPKLWIEIIDESGIGITHGSRMISWLRGLSNWPYITHTALNKRGIYDLGPTKVIAGDPFGLFYREQIIPATDKIMVLPYYEPITSFPAPSGYLPGGKALRIRSLEVTPYAVGVREYQPGDPLRRIDWKSTARQDKLMVKEFEQDPEANVWIFLDASEDSNEVVSGPSVKASTEASMAIYSLGERRMYRLPKEPFEYSVSLTASLCDYYVKGEKSIGLIMAGQGLFRLSPDLGERQLDKLFEALAIVKPEGRETFAEFIESQITPVPKGSTIILISASARTELAYIVRGLKYRNYTPIFVGINKQSFGASLGNEGIIAELQFAGIQTLTVNYGDSLGNIGNMGSFE